MPGGRFPRRYWGEMGYARVEKGSNALLLLSGCAWAVPLAWTSMSTGGNTPCHEDGGNCDQHEPPGPDRNCNAFCSKKAIATCGELGMQCNCGDAQYNTTGKGLPKGESCGHNFGCSGKCTA